MREKVYNFCPKCGGELADLKCKKCGFEYYVNSKPTASIVITNNKNEVLLVKRKDGINIGKQCLPGGFLENFEHPEDAIRRETKEEIGVDARVEKFLTFGLDPYRYGGGGSVLEICFKGKIESGVPHPTDAASEVKWFDKRNISWDDIAFESDKNALKEVFEK